MSEEEQKPREFTETFLYDLLNSNDIASVFKHMPPALLADIVIFSIANHLFICDKYDELKLKFNDNPDERSKAVANFIVKVSARSESFFTALLDLCKKYDIDFARLNELADTINAKSGKSGTPPPKNYH